MKKASVICVAYDNMERYFPPEKIIKTGNPVRKIEINENFKQEALKQFGLQPGKPVLFIMGGSLGARTINQSLLKNIDLVTQTDISEMESIFIGGSFQEDYKILSQNIRNLGEVIPPLINSYINLSPTLRCFGTVINNHFGAVEETAIMVALKDMYETKTERHFKSFIKEEQGYDKF